MGYANMTVQVICDFDGTIAERDMIVAIMREFCYDRAAPFIEAVQSGQMSVKAGVEAMFRCIPSEQMNDVIAFAKSNTVVRPGFHEFIHRCGQLGWHIAVVSGGFDFFVHPVIHNLSTHVDSYCNRIDSTGAHLNVVWAVACDATCDGGCGLCKPTVMRQLQTEDTKFVVIGDGVTDFKAARMADYVFARHHLQNLVQDAAIPSSSFETFFDIERSIRDGGHPIHAHL